MSIGDLVISRRFPLDNDKYEKSAYTSEYRISVELKFCNIEASLGAIYRDNKSRRIIYAGEHAFCRGFVRSGRIAIVNSDYLNLRSATVHAYLDMSEIVWAASPGRKIYLKRDDLCEKRHPLARWKWTQTINIFFSVRYEYVCDIMRGFFWEIVTWLFSFISPCWLLYWILERKSTAL